MKTFTLAAFGAAVIIAGVIGFRAISSDTSDNAGSGDAAKSNGSPAAGNSGRRGAGGRSRPAPLIVASDVTQVLINDRLKAVGNGTAQASVSVVPLSGGVLTEVLVSPGQQVEANSILARLDDEEQQIARDRAAREAAEAEADATRLEQLYRSRTTTQVERNRARAALSDAQLALRDAELKLARRTITAPIAGIVGFVSVDTGNYIDAQTELMTIDDRSELVVEFWVPERFANQITLEQNVMATALADPGKQYDGIVSGIGSRIERDSRTLPVKARIKNPMDKLRPGMSFELQLRFPGQTYPAVNPLAIQWDSGGSFVWQIVDSKVQKIPARIIQRNPESVLVDATLKPGDKIASEGLLSLRPGASVRIEGASQRPPTPEGGARQGKPAASASVKPAAGS
ncbi:MAG: efflux RND transporter periplasmic adaptor subunit [Granulosicoccus sp.]